LFGVETSGNADERPRVAWSSPNVLRITRPLRSLPKVLTRQAEGVQVDVHFDPDDPTARAAWLEQIAALRKQVGLPPPEPMDDAAKP